MERSAQITRLLSIITSVVANPGRLTVKAMADKLEYSQRTIFRDLATLNAAEIPITYDPQTGGYRLSTGFLMPPVNLEVTELLALAISAQALANTPYQKTVAGLLDKLLSGIPKEKRTLFRRLSEKFAVRIGPASVTPVKKEMFANLNEAIVKSRRILVTYRSPATAKPTERRIDPYGLAFRRSAWYLVGFCHLRNAIRIFRVNRFTGVRLLPEQFRVPSNFSIDEFFADAWGVVSDGTTTIKVKFDAEVAPFLKETKFHPTQRLETQSDGSVIFSAQAAGVDEISSWILSWGEYAEALEPKELRDLVARRARLLIKHYPDETEY